MVKCIFMLGRVCKPELGPDERNILHFLAVLRAIFELLSALEALVCGAFSDFANTP